MKNLKIEKGIKVYIEDSVENRSKVLIKEYIKGNDTVKGLIDCLDNFKKYLNDNRVEEYKELLKEGDCKTVYEEFMVKYHDSLYSNSFKIKDFYEIINKDKNETINRYL